MKCPSCLYPVNFARQHCPRCKASYQESFEARAWEPKHKKKTHAAHKRRAAGPGPVLGAAVLGAALLWLALAPRAGLPLPASALLNDGHGFAYAPPRGWTVDSSERPKQGLVSAARISDGSVEIEVLVGPSSLYAEASEQGGALRLARSQFNGAEVRLESSAAAAVDGLPALRLLVAGGRTVLPSPNAGRQASSLAQAAPRFESLEFAGELVAIPGAGRSYLIKATADRDSLSRDRESLDALVSSFRVTRRPLSLGHLREALTGAGP